MLKFALPNKGSLADAAVTLLQEAGYSCSRIERELMLWDKKNEVEFAFLRPRDIAVYVGNGIFDLGITGRDLALDSASEVTERLALGFGKAAFCYAVPREQDITPEDFGGLRIATSYPQLVKQDLARRNLEARVVALDGAVEVSVQLGVADVIADVVESGRTLHQAGLKIVGDPVLDSEAVVIGRPDSPRNSACDTVLDRLRGILLAREYLMVEYDIPENLLKRACAITPGIESPTISPLNEPGWFAVKAMTRKAETNGIIDELAELGAKGILVTNIRTCRI